MYNARIHLFTRYHPMLWLLSRLWKWGQLLAVTLISAVVFGVMVACGDWLFSIYLPILLIEERLQYLSNLFPNFSES